MIGQVARDVARKLGKHRDCLPASGVNIREGNGMAVRVRPLTNVNGVVGHAGVLAIVPTRLNYPAKYITREPEFRSGPNMQK